MMFHDVFKRAPYWNHTALEPHGIVLKQPLEEEASSSAGMTRAGITLGTYT